jgi:hypothetical protein
MIGLNLCRFAMPRSYVRYVPEAVTPGTRTSHERTGSDLAFFLGR